MKRFMGAAVFFIMVLALVSPALATGLIDSHDVNQTQVNAPTTINAPVATGGTGIGGVGIGGGATIEKGAVSSTNLNTNVNTNKSESKSSSYSSSGAYSKSGVKDSGNSTVSVDASTGDTPYQAPSVFAPNLTAVPETCMGSISTGGSAAFSGAGFGLTFGTTWKSHPCELRMFARALQQLGPQYVPAAVALLAQDADVKKALQDAGIAIPGVKAEVPVAPVASVPGAVKQEKRDVSEIKDNRGPVRSVSHLQRQMEQMQGM